MIPVTEFAIGSSLPEQVLSPLGSGTGFTVEGNLGGSRVSVVPQTLADCRSCCASKISSISVVGMAGAPANAVTTTLTGTLTSDHCTDGCGPQTGGFGTITVVDNGLGTGGAVGTLAFTVQLINSNTFAAGGQDVTFGFDLAGNPTITYSVLPNSLPNTRAWFIPNVGAGNTQAAGTLHADGFGDVEYGVEMDGSGASGSPPDLLKFSISAVNLDWTDLETIMVADIFAGSGPGQGNTGFVDFTGNLVITPVEENPPGTPIPGAVWLFAGGLGLLGMFYRKKEKPKSAWA